ncbi:hypothetical protein Taro_055845 [Colocasia esculenta]|uniref:Fungal lipase-type domain-containing protein n=1 Tax=Colocasia esculenta TaxID=4460 RepID=A0A843XVI5_COLES|nr:hypothetical protein [Colocasia esculenta]
MDDEGARRGYWIFRLEKARIRDIFSLLFTRRTISDYDFVDSGEPAPSPLSGGDSSADFKTRSVIAVVLAVQMMLSSASGFMASLGRGIEFLLNLPSFNGGFRSLIRRLLTASVVKPKREAKEFRSINAHLNGRLGLGQSNLAVPAQTQDGNINLIELLYLTILAASRAYENEANVTDVVNNHWKMHFVEFYNCWNKFLKKNATKAFIFCDKAEDASLICVAFRGTELFDFADWQTDLDISYVSMGSSRGRVHLGFMKALGLQDAKDVVIGFPKKPPAEENGKPLAYYAIRKKLTELGQQHPKARILITGHSLGGALAALFPALLSYHDEKAILEKIMVIPHAQPRVGDKTFSKYMMKAIGDRYLRTVYRYDLVPRVPPTSRFLNVFAHFGKCVYYTRWYAYKEVETVPNWNYFNPIYNTLMYWGAWEDLFWAFYLREGIESVVYRFVVGILVPIFGPGIVCHNTRNYLNGAEYAREQGRQEEDDDGGEELQGEDAVRGWRRIEGRDQKAM